MARFTKRVLHGLNLMLGYVEAGGSTDMMGYDEEDLDEEQKRDWADVQRAIRWIKWLASSRTQEGTEKV